METKDVKNAQHASAVEAPPPPPTGRSSTRKTTVAFSSSSDSDHGRGASKSSDWTINLVVFSKSKTKLDTAINDSTRCGELMRAYFSNQDTAFTHLPWKGKRPAYGAYPLQTKFYVECDANDKDAIEVLGGIKHVKRTPLGNGILAELIKDNSEHLDISINYGEEKGNCFATYDQMLFYPRKAFDAFREYCESHDIHDEEASSIKSISIIEYKRIIKKCKRWLRANHRMWSTIIAHLDSGSMHVTGGMELSNGIVLLSTLKTKYGHTHAQCLAAMLRILTNVTMLTKDPNTGNPETIADYMSRVERIARDASAFPAMKVPIAKPLVKVFALEGLVKSDDKYSSMVTMAYSNDLQDSFETLTTQMQTVEGLRGKYMQDEYAGTHLVTASIQQAEGHKPSDSKEKEGWKKKSSGKKPGRGRNDPCHLKGHRGHTNANCSVQKLNKIKASGNFKPLFLPNGARVCDFVSHGVSCPFKKCNSPHRLHGARASRPNNTAKSYRTTTDSSDSYEDRRRSRKHKKTKKSKRKHHNHKKRHSKAYVARSSSGTGTTSDSSTGSDFR